MDKSVDKKVKIGLLFSFYRNMLTDRQIECIDLYYNEDLSLAEISEHLGITRQGVRDNIKRAEHTMYDRGKARPCRKIPRYIGKA